MNAIKWTLAALTVGLLSACGSTTKDEPAEPAVTNQNIEKSWCTFDDGKTEAPEFFCTGVIGEFEITGRGSYPKSKAGMNFMVDQASLQAKTELASNIKAEVSKWVTNYLGTTGVGEQETVDAAASSTSESLTAETLVGSRIIRRIIGPEGEVYIWMAVDEKNLVASAQHAIRTSMKNDEAGWQQFLADKSHEEMAKKIVEYRERNSQ